MDNEITSDEAVEKSKGLSLQAKILLSVIGLTLLVLVGSAVIRIVMAQNDLESRLLDRANIVTSLQSKAIAAPMWDLDNEAAGKLLQDLSQDPDFQYAEVVDPKGTLLFSHGESTESSSMTRSTSEIKHTEGDNSETIGTLTLILSHDSLTSSIFSQIITTAIFTLITLGVISTVVFTSFRKLTVPMAKMTDEMGQLVAGHLDVEIGYLDRNDEVGNMAQAIQVFKVSAIEKRVLEGEQEQSRLEAEAQRVEAEKRREQRAIETEEAKKRAEEEQNKALINLVTTFEGSVGSVVDGVASAATEMQATAQTLTGISQRTTDQANSVAHASSNATSNVQSVASAAEELSASIREISQQVSQSSAITNQAVDEAGKADVLIKGLDTGAQNIGEVVSLIQDIAEQTNLLALNATIEAARAGDAGKGFAVVASEVKNLASQTAKATEQISGQISEVQNATTKAVDAIQGISGTIRKVDEIAAAIASAVEEQGAATQEISSSVQKAAAGTQEVSSSIGSVTEAATESDGASKEVLSASQELSQQAENLRAQVATFVQNVKTG